MYFQVLLVTMLVFSGCATILKGTSETVHINSNPADASVYRNGSKVGNVADPQLVNRDFDTHTIILKKDGYRDTTINIRKKFDPIGILNVLFWPGFIIDAVSGAMMKPEQTNYVVELEKK